MKEYFRMTFVLAVTGAVSAFLLAATYSATRAPIEAAFRQERTAAINRVLPPHDNDPAEDAVAVNDDGRERTFYVARRGSEFAGAAFAVSSDKGYSGFLEVLVGISADGTVCAVEALKQSETPGLGAKIADSNCRFMSQFRGLRIAHTRWALKKNGGDIDAITGATITSRAVLDAIKGGLDAYQRNRQALEAAGRAGGRPAADKGSAEGGET